jgi:predicted Na+-dependent transporter
VNPPSESTLQSTTTTTTVLFLTVNMSSDTENPLTDDGTDDDSSGEVFASTMSNVFLFFLIFGLSATVEIKNLRHQLGNKFAIGAGVAMQFLIMPVLGFVSILALRNSGLTEAMGITLLVVTSSPGGSYSNWWCSTFNAELALSVAMTTVSSLLSIGMLPANLLFYSYLAYGSDEEDSILEALDFGTLFISLGIVMAAIILGLWCGATWDSPRFHEMANRLGSISGLCLILFGVFISSGADGAESNFWNHPWAFYLAVAFPCLVGIALANVLSRSLRLSHPETVAISIECCYQNTYVAVRADTHTQRQESLSHTHLAPYWHCSTYIPQGDCNVRGNYHV